MSSQSSKQTVESVDDEAIITGNRSLLDTEGSSIILPTYRSSLNPLPGPIHRSNPQPLVPGDVAESIFRSLKRARLILFETEPSERSLRARLRTFMSRRALRLTEPRRSVDIALAAAEEELKKLVTWTGPLPGDQFLPPKSWVLGEPALVKTISDTKTNFLRMDRELRSAVIEPLKIVMIEGQPPNYTLLVAKIEAITSEILDIFDIVQIQYLASAHSIR